MPDIRDLTAYIRTHPCYHHPIFEHWVQARPRARAVGALFHQIRSFCDATRPGGAMPRALAEFGFDVQHRLIQEIVDSEAGHAPDLATMAGFVLNRAAGAQICKNVHDQDAVEATLKGCSDDLLGMLPGYDHTTGLTVQCRAARAVFASRDRDDYVSTVRNLGTALALEMISNRHLIPGEKLALVDSCLYGVNLDQPEMHYLAEHWGEVGAEAQHEQHAIEAVAALYSAETAPLLRAGAAVLLNSLGALWDVLDAALLHSGFAPRPDVGIPGEAEAAR